jgi:ribonuclease Y
VEALTLFIAADDWLMPGLIGIGVGILIGILAIRFIAGMTLRAARKSGEQIIRNAEVEADALTQRAELENEKKASKRKAELEREIEGARGEIKQAQARLATREDRLDKKLESITERETRFDRQEQDLKQRETELTAAEANVATRMEEVRRRLEQLSGMTEAQARELFMDEVRHEADHEASILTQQIVEEAEVEARGRSREITLMAIQRFAAEHVADSTVRSVRIPSDDMKGRIIGREGRNIRSLEKATGVDILVDDTPGVIAVSCFDPIRRAIAAESLQKLVADGRVHPSRIEEIVKGVQRDMEERIQKAGNDAVIECNIRGLHPKIVEAIGKLHFRTSYGQNVLRHTVEVAYLSQMIADQLGLDGELARRCGFLHDIGKAMDHEMEGGHPAIGMEFCRRYRERDNAVLNAIGGHHGDIEATSPYTPIVMAADAVSGARPGARRESMEMYIKRLEQLEALAREHPEVEEAHAIQAGREVRVIVNAERADDATAHRIAKQIAKRVEEEMTFPGEIKVTVLREVRAEALAR